MPKVDILVKRERAHSPGLVVSSVKRIFPFYQSRDGAYIHRIRSARMFWRRKDMSFSHLSVELWCGMIGSQSKNRPHSVMEFAPDGSVICATCEGRAIGSGMLGSREINGREVLFQPKKDERHRP